VASRRIRRRPAAKAILEPHENHEWRTGLAVNGLYHRNKASVQRAPLRSAKCADNVGRPGDPLRSPTIKFANSSRQNYLIDEYHRGRLQSTPFGKLCTDARA